MFKGADHAFLWKPKLRIPDIYENRDHQLAFSRFLGTCACCMNQEPDERALERHGQEVLLGACTQQGCLDCTCAHPHAEDRARGSPARSL
jgi:hypothetical protein